MFKRRGFLAALTAAAVLIAGCGGGDDTSDTTAASAENPQTVRVGVIPAIDVAPLYLGVEKGFFLEEGLDVKPELAAGGAATIPSVISGDYQFAFAGVVPLILAKEKGLPVQIVAPGNRAVEDLDKTWEGLMVQEDGPIKQLKDLEGKTIATNAIKGQSELAIRELLDRAGVNVDRVKFSELAIPDMPAGLSGGRVPAVAMSEPFLSIAAADGARNLTPMFAGVDPGSTVGAYFTSEETIAKDEQLVQRFARAMNVSSEYAQAHPEEARAAVATYAKIPAPVLEKLQLPLWGSDMNQPSIQLMADLAAKHGFAKQKLDVSGLIWSGANAGS